MKAEAVLCSFLTLIPALCGSQASFSHVSMNEQIVTGRLREDVILPCSFESGPGVVIHWKNQDTNVYSYCKDCDQLETQDPRYVNRLSLFPGEIYNGNASLCFRRLTIYDEGIYICHVGTSLGTITKKVVLQVVDVLHKMESENVLLSCKPENNFSPPNQDFTVTWSRVENGSSLLLACFKNSSQETLISQPQISWKEEPINSRDFSLTLKDLRLSDSGEYLCNITSNESTLLTMQTLHVAYCACCSQGRLVTVDAIIDGYSQGGSERGLSCCRPVTVHMNKQAGARDTPVLQLPEAGSSGRFQKGIHLLIRTLAMPVLQKKTWCASVRKESWTRSEDELECIRTNWIPLCLLGPLDSMLGVTCKTGQRLLPWSHRPAW
uniref:Uncharacterized protein n=1 Tax=Rangifer tarandus platyrhynchus TaxID=3082113 RepID=A0ACB0ESI5_RANTA|nr:unnamed protein product [Rangifer tarandus platyrhynchus]